MKKLGVFLLVVGAIVVLFSVSVGARKPTKIKFNKVVKMNIAGSKVKEKIEVTREKIMVVDYYENYYYKYQIKINDKVVKKLESSVSYGECEFYLADLNTKDKYMELIVQVMPTDVSNPHPQAFRYKKKKLVSTTATFKIPEMISGEKKTYNKVNYFLGYVKEMKLMKNGQFKMKVLTDVSGPIGYKWITFSMSNGGKITRVN